MAKLNILFLGSQMTVGGAQRVLLDQAAWFYQRGHRVTTAFLYDRDGFENEWSAKYPFPILNLQAVLPKDGGRVDGFRLLGAMIRLIKIILRQRINVIETFTPHANLIGIPLAWLTGVPCRIASYHGPVERFPGILARLHALVINLGMATQLVTVSNHVRDQAIAEGISSRRIRTIYNGINLVPPNNEIRLKIRSELGVEEDAPLILSVGRLVEQKAHSILVRAVPKVREHFPKVQFVLVGDGTLRADLEAEIDRLGLRGSVMLVGARENVSDYIAAADMFVLPSRAEGLGVALLEAMGGGVASVATHVGGITEIIQDGENGLLVPPDDPVLLADAIVELLADPTERKRIGLAGRATVESGFLVDGMCEQYLDIFLANLG